MTDVQKKGRFSLLENFQKIPLSRLPPEQMLIPPLPPNTNFHVVTQQKLHFKLQSLLLYHFNFILVVHRGHVNFYFDAQYLQNVVFSYEKDSNSQNPSSSGSHCQKKKIPSSKISSSFLSDEMSNCVRYGGGQMTRFVQKKSPINALL